MKTRLRQRFPSTRILLLSLFIAAMGLSCGGGGGSAPPPANQDASGLYNGSGTVAFVNVKNKANLALSDMKGIIHKNRFMFFNINSVNFLKGIQDKNVLIDGTITSITKSNLVGTADIYQAGQIVSKNIPVTGTVTGRSQISLTLAATTAEAGAPAGNFLGGSVQGTFDLQYDNTASEAIIDNGPNKEWGTNTIPYLYMLIPYMNAALVMNPNPNDNTYENVAGNTSNTCVFSGTESIPNNKINIYTLIEKKVLIGKGCLGIGGTSGYTGLASVLSITNKNDTLWYAVSNGTYSVYALLDRVL